MTLLSIFRKEQPPTVQHCSTAESRLVELEKEYRQAESDFVEASFQVAKWKASHKDLRTMRVGTRLYSRIAPINTQAVLTHLESVQTAALIRRNELLARRAELLQALKTV
jgi:hypothetical protein